MSTNYAIFVALGADHFLKHGYVLSDDVDALEDQQVLQAADVRTQVQHDFAVVSSKKAYEST